MLKACALGGKVHAHKSLACFAVHGAGVEQHSAVLGDVFHELFAGEAVGSAVEPCQVGAL